MNNATDLLCADGSDQAGLYFVRKAAVLQRLSHQVHDLINQAESLLNHFLVTNIADEGVFEDIPDIDEARGKLIEAIELLTYGNVLGIQSEPESPELDEMSVQYIEVAVDSYLYEKGYDKDSRKEMSQEDFNNEIWNFRMDLTKFVQKYCTN